MGQNFANFPQSEVKSQFVDLCFSRKDSEIFIVYNDFYCQNGIMSHWLYIVELKLDQAKTNPNSNP